MKYRENKIYDAVNITVDFDDKICSQQNGLLVKIVNNSNVTIAYVGWRLSVYQPECSGCPTKKDEKIVSYKTLPPQTEHLASVSHVRNSFAHPWLQSFTHSLIGKPPVLLV